MTHELTPEEQEVSWRTVRRHLFFAELVDNIDADPETIGTVLRSQGLTTESTLENFRKLQNLVGSDGIFAARLALSEAANDH